MKGIAEIAARRLRALLAVASTGLASGCATITGAETQNLSLQATDAAGAAVDKTECTLANDKGNWRAKPPAIAVVARSSEDLLMQCEAEGRQPGIVRAVSRANSGMVGNIIFGGGIGALIDHNKGTAYDYPSMLRVVFGSSRVIDKKNEPGDAPAMPSTPPSAADSSKPVDGSLPTPGQAVVQDERR